ncbi:MAG: hypothetical protein GY750_19650 [Lentisphaerae bacterium]|nr:hypothetical protein [Lentisphaerota bacterium]MCP4103613.1 hypothetical protein [Lentisphaerota bacterium]
MTRKRIVTVLLSAGLIATTLMISGCRHRRKEPPPPPHRAQAVDPPNVGMHSCVERSYSKTIKQLGLTEAQKIEVQKAYGNFFTEAAKIKYSDENQSRKIDKIKDAKEALDKRMKSILTEDQYIKYEKIISERPKGQKEFSQRHFRGF